MNENIEIIEHDKTNINNKKINKTGRKKDPAREYYIKRDNKLYCIINNCNFSFSSNTSISVLKTHIKNCHNDIINKQNKDGDKNNNEFKDKNDLIVLNDINDDSVYTLFSIVFAKKSLPYSLIEDKHFNLAIEMYSKVPNLIMSAYKLKEKTLINGEKIYKDVINNLSKNKTPITLAIDGWTNVRSNKVTNILLMSNGNANFYSSIENYSSNNKADWLVSQLEIKINELINNNVIIVAITTDNENLMKAVCKKLKIIYPVLIDIPCCSHLFQLCLKSICDIDEINKVVKEVVYIINTVKNTRINAVKLEDLQKVDGIKIPLKLIVPIMIRWASLIMSMERILYLQKYIELIIPDLKKDTWNDINNLYLYIKPFKNYIDQSQKNNVTLCTISKSISELITHFKKVEVPAYLNKNKKDIVKIIKDKWNKHINETIIKVANCLNFDETVKIDSDVIDFIKNWGSIYLSVYKLVTEKDMDIIKGIINLQIRELISKQSEFINLYKIIDDLKKICAIKEKNYNPILVWSGFIATHYELSTIAIGILSICPSEASVERSFSMQSDIHSLDRNKLSSELIEAELRIKFNIDK